VQNLHADATFSATRATLLGTALAGGSAELFAAALADRLHEPYRAENAPLLVAVRERLPVHALGATLSGSGPSVIVWAKHDRVSDCVLELVRTFADTRVMPLDVSPAGAARVETTSANTST
jgi:homoserine kinase